MNRLPLDRILSQEQLQVALEIITSAYRWPDFQLTAEALYCDAKKLQAPRLVDVINLVYRALNPLAKPRLGDKTPPYIQIVPELAELYPNARFVHLIRDGRDVAISFLDAGFYDKGGRFFSDGRSFEWTSAIRPGCRYRQSRYSTQIMDVRYEQLVFDPEGTLTQICAFLGESFEAGMLKHNFDQAWIPDREEHTR